MYVFHLREGCNAAGAKFQPLFFVPLGKAFGQLQSRLGWGFACVCACIVSDGEKKESPFPFGSILLNTARLGLSLPYHFPKNKNFETVLKNHPTTSEFLTETGSSVPKCRMGSENDSLCGDVSTLCCITQQRNQKKGAVPGWCHTYHLSNSI